MAQLNGFPTNDGPIVDYGHLIVRRYELLSSDVAVLIDCSSSLAVGAVIVPYSH